ncbi:LamG domain-containing protein [Zooshikella ganghwensis]|uniref:LamG domain-containing protein n=1 Tax=Zooshikella ganghwensis TaxID=202772 RepID=UPI0022A8B957|nr:LamG-like jellyroll fold domain-containing protein [Zooshikella ganghwensis]
MSGTSLKPEQTNPFVVNVKANGNKFDINGPFALSFWFKPTKVNAKQVLVEKSDSTTDTLFSIFVDTDNRLKVVFRNAAGVIGGVESLDPLPNLRNKWQHVVFSFSGHQSGLNLALNGHRLKDVKLGLPEDLSTDNPWVFGNSVTEQLNNPLIGELDEIHLYSRAISSLEANCLADLGFHCVPTFYQGPPGLRGPQGAPGIPGKQGKKGEKGDRGPQGEKGDKGDKGDVGPIGLQEPQGLKGEKGDQGPRGEKGPQGPRGEKGLQGPAGKDGKIVFYPISRVLKMKGGAGDNCANHSFRNLPLEEADYSIVLDWYNHGYNTHIINGKKEKGASVISFHHCVHQGGTAQINLNFKN